MDAALQKGDLKFTLDGYKLKGSWVLVRTRGYGGNAATARSWLLIKHRDDWSGDLDITEFAPLSVKTGFDLDEILAEDKPDIWQSNRTGRRGRDRCYASRDHRARGGAEGQTVGRRQLRPTAPFERNRLRPDPALRRRNRHGRGNGGRSLLAAEVE